LTELFEQERKLWWEMAQRAYAYTKRYVEGSGVRVRVDDVIKTLVPALTVTPRLRTYLAEKKLKEKYWTTWFGDFVLDEFWGDLEKGEMA
jgi:hypothetical protein